MPILEATCDYIPCHRLRVKRISFRITLFKLFADTSCSCVYISGVSLAEPSLGNLEGLYLRELSPVRWPGPLSPPEQRRYGHLHVSHDGLMWINSRPVFRLTGPNAACPQYLYYHSRDTAYWLVGPTIGLNRGMTFYFLYFFSDL